MTTTLLQPSSENIPEITNVSIRTLRDSNRVNLLADTLITFANANKEGQQITLAFYQADTVPHIVTYDNMVRLGTDIFSFPTLSTTIATLDRMVFIFDSFANTYDLSGYSRGYV